MKKKEKRKKSCFHILAPVNNPTMNVCSYLFDDPVFSFLCYVPRSGMLNHTVVLFLGF